MNFKRVAPVFVMFLASIGCAIAMAHANASAGTILSIGKVSWVKFTDPLEQAFTLEVPEAGW